MADHTPAYLLITTDQSVNPVSTPYPSLAAAQHDSEKGVPVLTNDLRERFNAGGRLAMVFFSLSITRSSGRTVEQHMQFIVPVGDTAFCAVSSQADGEWTTSTAYLDPETWEPLPAEPLHINQNHPFNH